MYFLKIVSSIYLLYSYPCSKAFWDDFELFWFSGTQETIDVT